MRCCRPLLGTYVEIEADSVEAIEAGFAAIAKIHALMSAHDPDSELSRINRFGHESPVEVSGETRRVVERALHWSRESGGAFDVVGAGSKSFASGRIPRHRGQPTPRAEDFSAMSLSDDGVRLLEPACLDLGGIAKGFAVDQAVATMRCAGAERGFVNAGGDLFAFGPNPWPVAVVHPLTRRPLVEVELRDEALATSALFADGSADHLPASAGWMSVSVRAANACDADALTKVAWALGHRSAGVLTAAGAAAFAIRSDGAVEAIESMAAAA